MSWRERIDSLVDEHFEQLVELRRHLHSHPELSGQELETSLHLYQLLTEKELKVRMGPEGRGVLADGGDLAAKDRVALRADIDALPIQDEKLTDYRSECAGVMHACGHDVHTACVFGAISALTSLAEEGALPQPIAWRAIFQPSEETATGAAEMVAADAMQDVKASFALHVDPARSTGTVGVRSGVLTAYAEMLRIEISGSGGHAARPHESHDPIAAAAQLISTIYQFVPRRSDSQDAVVVTFGQVTGGMNANVIPDHVTLQGTVRTLDRAVRQRTLDHIRHLMHGVAEITGTRIELFHEVSLPSVDNDPALSAMLKNEATDLLGTESVHEIARPSMGSEDFALYGEHAPLVMFRLGCASTLPAPGLHTSLFDVDERCIAVGAKLLARAALGWCRLSGS